MEKYHLIGIKGSGMSALAQVLADTGNIVQGSDVKTHFFTQKALEDKHIPIYPFGENKIDTEMKVIVTSAFGDDHPEVQEAISKGVPLYRYYDFLGQFAKGYTSIAVSGSHGKTTTTGMLAHVLKETGDVSYLIGDGTGYGQKDSSTFIFEACEYRRHFLHYHPDYAIVTNMDFDHPDYFKDEADVVDAFQAFAGQVQKGIVICGDDRHVEQIQADVPMLTYGFAGSNQLQAVHLQTTGEGIVFEVLDHGKSLGHFTIAVFGTHNVLNALAVIGICLLRSVDLETVRQQLATFQGVKRRFSEKECRSNVIIDDYAHHPAEVTATLEAARSKYPTKKLISIFQPHTYTRTAMFLDEFADALSASDAVYVCDIFGSARENQGGISTQDVLNKIPGAQYISEETTAQLQKHEDAVLLFMGAGDIQKLQHAFEQQMLSS